MENVSNVSYDKDIIDSLKFYFMLSSYLCSRDIPESQATQSMDEFIREGANSWYRQDSKLLSAYLQRAYDSIPSGFLSFMGISVKGDHDPWKVINSKRK